jgi:hypothetical protein
MKVILCVVVSMLLGFGVVHVVDSLWPIRSMPQMLHRIPNQKYGAMCNSIGPYSKWTGHSNTCNKALHTSFTYQLESTCSTTSLFASLSEASASPEPTASVWVQLYVDRKKEGDPLPLAFTKRSKRDALSVTKMVKKEYSDKLERISAAKLMVYAWNDERFTKMLHPQEGIAQIHGGNTSTRPIIVSAAKAKTKSTRKSTSSIWYQLYIDNKKFGRSWKLKVEPDANVAALATAVKNEYMEVVDVISGEMNFAKYWIPLLAQRVRNIPSLVSMCPVHIVSWH